MCGIFAAIRLDKPFTKKEYQMFEASLSMISYRGPDATNKAHFSSLAENTEDQSNIFLGHNRLAIIDLSAEGIQPFTNDNKIFIIFNGEIYNYIELREDLKKRGYEFKTQTDTEVIINLYKAEGSKGFGKMNGMWSFVLYDSEKKQVIVSRDRFAIKPLYYTIVENTFFVGSEIKQILPFLSSIKPNFQTIGNFLHSYLIDYDNDTFFEEIKKLPQKCSMTIDLLNKNYIIKPYWEYHLTDFSRRKENDLNEEFLYLLKDSIRVRLRSDVKVGNTLSGGLDSSSIAVLADEISPTPLKNISVIARTRNLSEEKFVDILAKKSKIDLQKIYLNENDMWHQLEKVIWHNDEPILSLSTVAHYNMMQEFKKQTDITVILSGQGGDESLGGYNKYFFENIKQLKKEHKYLSLVNEGIRLFPKFFGEFKIQNASRYLNHRLKNSSIIENVIHLDYQNQFITNSTSFRDRQILDIDKFSVPALTHYEDRTSMSQSLEIRLPFLDFRLVNFNLNLPIEYKIRNGWSKYILRNSLKSLPKEIAWRKDKKGFTTEENGIVSIEHINKLENLFKKSVLHEMGVLDADKFVLEVKKFLAGKKTYWIRDINRVIFTEIWAKQFLK